MAKYPAPGTVKTRLAREVGAERACALYRGFVEDLAERLADVPETVTWAYWPPEAPFARLLPGARCRPQAGDDLGARMAQAVVEELAEQDGPVVMIGADVPHVLLDVIATAFDDLRTGADLVLGPALDGGYYLIGLRVPQPALFRDMSWSTTTVLQETLARSRALGLRTRLLPEAFDVDGPEDLARLHVLLASGAVVLPRTWSMLSAPADRY